MAETTTNTKIAEEDAGDFHFELHRRDGKFACMRSDLSAPDDTQEEVTEITEIPKSVFSTFNKLMS